MLNLFSFRTMAIIKRELKAQVMTKTFIFTTIFVPIIMVGLMGLQTFLMMFEGKKDIQVEVYTERYELVSMLEKEYQSSDDFNRETFKIDFKYKEKSELENYVQEVKPSLLDRALNGVFFIPNGDRFDKTIEYYSANPKNSNITSKVTKMVNSVLVENHFAGKSVSEKDIEYARDRVSLQNFKISEKDEVEKDNYGAILLAGVLAFMLYMSLIMIGMQILKAVVEEKENRVVEVLLSSVHANELMSAKIVATTCAGLLQIVIWMLPFIFVSVTSIFVLPEKLQFSISLFQIGYFILNYGLGLITFLGLYAAVGAIFDNMSEAQQGAMPIMFLILVPFYICFTMLKDPTNSIAQVCSMIPFSSIIVMPVRMAMIDVPLWEVGVATLVNLITLLFVFSFAGKIYRIGVLKTGKRPKWKEVYRWIKN